MGVSITKEGNHEPKINDRINKGQSPKTELNSILWDRDVTLKTKTNIYHAIVKSTIAYAAEKGRVRAKKVAKLNSTEIDFWRRSARISRIRVKLHSLKLSVVLPVYNFRGINLELLINYEKYWRILLKKALFI